MSKQRGGRIQNPTNRCKQWKRHLICYFIVLLMMWGPIHLNPPSAFGPTPPREVHHTHTTRVTSNYRPNAKSRKSVWPALCGVHIYVAVARTVLLLARRWSGHRRAVGSNRRANITLWSVARKPGTPTSTHTHTGRTLQSDTHTSLHRALHLPR